MLDAFLRAFATAFGIGAGLFTILFVAGLCMRLTDAIGSARRKSLVERVYGRGPKPN